VRFVGLLSRQDLRPAHHSSLVHSTRQPLEPMHLYP